MKSEKNIKKREIGVDVISSNLNYDTIQFFCTFFRIKMK